MLPFGITSHDELTEAWRHHIATKILSSLVQVMACQQSVAKPLPGLGPNTYLYLYSNTQIFVFVFEQGKSEGFESCDRPIVRKRPILVKLGDVLSRVTLKFDG